MRFFAYHGCKAEETENGQYFEVDVELTGSLQKPGKTDDLNDTCDFDCIYRIIADTVTGTRYNLLEALGEEICSRLLKKYPDKQVKLILRKPNPPLDEKLSSRGCPQPRQSGLRTSPTTEVEMFRESIG